ncbi:hypothetical protein [Azospirillum halopraeferens]|uniref:hypothetical protein n=1 Tax=Azospirillum halopraeferens TaxID=34010 RepID=UPI0003FB4561|nr:hypothetical protein [Azospirillum halopraeferens]
MFQLFVVACVALRACEYMTVPLPYPTEARCAQQAAILAGMVRARHQYRELSYEYRCTATDRRQVAGTAPPSPGPRE